MQTSEILIYEIFKSLQGEGIEIGILTVFIRFAGCNLNCSWCDTKSVRDIKNCKIKTIDEILYEIDKYKIKNVCITGGEPLTQKTQCLNLIYALLDNNYLVSLETNGSISITDFVNLSILISMDIKCPSSCMQNKMNFENIKLMRKNDQLKFVIGSDDDYLYAIDVIKKYSPICNIILMPVYKKYDLSRLCEKVLSDNINNLRVLYQMHKLVGLK